MARPRARTLSLLALALVMAQVAPVSGEPTGSVPARTATASKSKPAKTAAAKSDAATTPACNRETFHVIVDVGHTASNPGANSARGVYEYDFNLKLATLIDKKLHDAGFAKIGLLITQGHIALPRASVHAGRACARHGCAISSCSIHHDSVPDRFLQKWQYEGEEHTYSDRFKGHSMFISRDNGDYRGSLLFGKMLGQQAQGPRAEIHAALRREVHGPPAAHPGRRRCRRLSVRPIDRAASNRTSRRCCWKPAPSSIAKRNCTMATPKRRGIISDAAVDAIEEFCESRSTQVAHSTQPSPSSKKKVSAGWDESAAPMSRAALDGARHITRKLLSVIVGTIVTLYARSSRLATGFGGARATYCAACRLCLSA